MGSIVMAGIGIIIYLAHNLKVASISSYKTKYDIINEHEVKNYKKVFLCFGISVLMLINFYGLGDLSQIGVWFFVLFFVSIAGGTLISYVAFLILDFYYPTILSKKLRKWRYMPRVGKSGNKLRLLSEEEEDVHLQEGMKAEEDVFSIDYDVWIDEKTGEVQIDKYPGYLQAYKCGSCEFHTMKIVREEITRQPDANSPGELIKHYQCLYCKSIRATSFNISTKEANDYAKASKLSFLKNKNIDLVRVEIHSAITGKKFFEFPTLDQAQKFLGEYDSEKVN
ncbi:MAG TPA: hypothetical protein PLJ60_12325 [Chryseolinea sp.]|nr:hypothetical protein [Chryseolinea sp.]